MAKRLTDSEKWKDVWFQDLPPKYKLFWFYILDNCTPAGFWKVNMRLAEFQIGEPLDIDEIFNLFGDRIEQKKDGMMFISKFIRFQYGTLCENSNPHKGVIKELTEKGIDYKSFNNDSSTLLKGLRKGSATLMDKDKDKDMDKDMDKDKDKSKKFTPPLFQEVQEYIKTNHYSVDPHKWFDFYSAKGWMIGKNKMKDWQAAVRTWARKDVVNKPNRDYQNQESNYGTVVNL